jgi:DnaK suppressor protein
MTAVPHTLAPDQQEQIRDELLRALARLERSLHSNGQASRPRDLEQDTVGRLSRIEAILNQGLVQNLAEREQQQLSQLADALRRLDAGEYGRCTACGDGIPFERLLLYPETQSCCTCARGG